MSNEKNRLPHGRAGRLFLWNDVLPERAREYQLWHTLEHVPERAWVPGITSGARYQCEGDRGAQCFTLFELSDISVLEEASYRDLVERPTPWSVSMRLAIRNFLRKPALLVATAGHVMGCGLSVTRLVWPTEAEAARAWPRLAGDLLAEGGDRLVTRVTISKVLDAGPQAFTNTDSAPAGSEYIVVVETADTSALGRLGALVEAVLSGVGSAPCWQHESRYRLLCHVSHGDVRSPARPTSRMDLMPSQAVSTASLL